MYSRMDWKTTSWFSEKTLSSTNGYKLQQDRELFWIDLGRRKRCRNHINVSWSSSLANFVSSTLHYDCINGEYEGRGIRLLSKDPFFLFFSPTDESFSKEDEIVFVQPLPRYYKTLKLNSFRGRPRHTFKVRNDVRYRSVSNTLRNTHHWHR